IVEGPVQLALAHAGSSIRHRDSHPLRSGTAGDVLCGHGDLATGFSGEAIDSVSYQILQDPPNHQRVGQSKRLLSGKLGADPGSIMADVADHLLDNGIDVAGLSLHAWRQPIVIASQGTEILHTRFQSASAG